MQNGKGDSPRKKGVSEETWARNWEQIFGKKPETNPDKKKPPNSHFAPPSHI